MTVFRCTTALTRTSARLRTTARWNTRVPVAKKTSSSMVQPKSAVWHGRERGVDVARGSGSQENELQPNGACRILQLRRLSRWIVWIYEEGDDCRIGDELVQQPQPLGSEFGTEPAHPGDVAGPAD